MHGGIDLLIVEDDSEFRQLVVQWMTRQQHRSVAVGEVPAALAAAQQRHFDVALVDMNLPGLSGLDFLHELRAQHVDTEVIFLTGEATVENAVEAMRRGAFDYLTKPFPMAELEQRCCRAAERSRMQRENAHLRELLQRSRPTTKLVGESTAMQTVLRLVDRVGPSDKPVLVLGESGTGKELVARALQVVSPRVDQPFVTINCAALPEQLVESELFGHEKGAFTGATASKLGLFEVANGGTLFIDEIGELPLSLQPKLLRVLEDGSFRRVGSYQERRVNVRILSATNRNLEEDVRAHRFREDLFYRINLFSLWLPPLRDREGDLPLLIQHFLGTGWDFEPDAMEALERYDWPGNVRQLRNVLERAQILADDKIITLDDMPPELLLALQSKPEAERTAVDEVPKSAKPREDSLAAIEREHIARVLQQERGNKARAARTLGIHRRKLYRLLDRFKLLDEDQEQES